MLGIAERGFKSVQLGFHRAPGISWQEIRQRFRRGMGAVRGGKSIIDVELAQLGHGSGKARIVPLLARMEAGILKDCDIARLHLANRCLCAFSRPIIDEP